MAIVKVRLYSPPKEELGHLTGRDAPTWAVRLYELSGQSPEKASAGAAVSALAGELGHRLKKLALAFGQMEGQGWILELEGHDVICRNDALSDQQAREQLEQLGVWMLVRLHASPDPGPGQLERAV